MSKTAAEKKAIETGAEIGEMGTETLAPYIRCHCGKVFRRSTIGIHLRQMNH